MLLLFIVVHVDSSSEHACVLYVLQPFLQDMLYILLARYFSIWTKQKSGGVKPWLFI